MHWTRALSYFGPLGLIVASVAPRWSQEFAVDVALQGWEGVVTLSIGVVLAAAVHWRPRSAARATLATLAVIVVMYFVELRIPSHRPIFWDREWGYYLLYFGIAPWLFGFSIAQRLRDRS